MLPCSVGTADVPFSSVIHIGEEGLKDVTAKRIFRVSGRGQEQTTATRAAAGSCERTVLERFPARVSLGIPVFDLQQKEPSEMIPMPSKSARSPEI